MYLYGSFIVITVLERTNYKLVTNNLSRQRTEVNFLSSTRMKTVVLRLRLLDRSAKDQGRALLTQSGIPEPGEHTLRST